jgi:hypothetical protein
MKIEELAEQVWQKEFSNNPEILNDSIYKHYFLIGFENGFQQGNTRPPMDINTVKILQSKLLENKTLQETMCMQLRISISQYFDKLHEFLLSQSMINKVYKNEAEINLHWVNWLRKQVISGAFKNNDGSGKL